MSQGVCARRLASVANTLSLSERICSEWRHTVELFILQQFSKHFHSQRGSAVRGAKMWNFSCCHNFQYSSVRGAKRWNCWFCFSLQYICTSERICRAWRQNVELLLLVQFATRLHSQRASAMRVAKMWICFICYSFQCIPIFREDLQCVVPKCETDNFAQVFNTSSLSERICSVARVFNTFSLSGRICSAWR
jgi:hypothetical protein